VLRTVRSRGLHRDTDRIGARRIVSAMSSGRSRCALTKVRCAPSHAALRAAFLRAVLRGCARVACIGSGSVAAARRRLKKECLPASGERRETAPMLGRALSLVAALLFACASTGAHGYARPLQPETAHRGFATAVQAAHRDQADVTPEAASENSPAITEASDGRRFYAKARYYGAGRGSFLSVDPWDGDPTSPVSLNKYLYGYANPGVYVDPDGRITILDRDARGLVNRAGEASLGMSERAAAAIRNAPWYLKPALAAQWAAGGAGYIASGAGDFVVSGANLIANGVVAGTDMLGDAVGVQETALSGLAREAYAETDALVADVAPVIQAFRDDPTGVSSAALTAAVDGLAAEVEAASDGESRAIFNLASNLSPSQLRRNARKWMQHAVEDKEIGVPRSVTMGEGADGGPAVQTMQGPSNAPLTAQQTKAARQRGVNRAKSAERELVRAGHPGTADEDWSWDERREIAETGQFPGDVRWHHVNDVKRNPVLADEPNNVRPVRGGNSGHVAKHHPHGGTRGGSSGELLDREDLLRTHLGGGGE
jgi:RHS repeat-associated protein